MGFEAPLALLGLLAAGLPVLAHLLRRRDLPRRPLPTVVLLRRAQAASRRRVRLVDMLLLAVRILLVMVAALAVAAPVRYRALAYGDGGVASVALVLDDSLSMRRGEPTLHEQARRRALAVIDALPAGSELAIVLAGAEPRVAVGRTVDLAVARRLVASLPAGARGTDLRGALDLAERELSGARHQDRRILLLSDFAGPHRLQPEDVPDHIAVAFERFGEEQPNVAVSAARATPDPTRPGQVSIAVEVRAPGRDGETLPLTLRRGEEELERRDVEVVEGAVRETLTAPLDGESPFVTVEVEVDDALAADDRRAVLVRRAAAARVLLVDGDPGPSRARDEVRFLARAVELAPGAEGALARRIVDPDTFATLDLADAEVVVLANVPGPSPAAARRLRDHVRAGGGLLWVAGDQVDPRVAAARLGDLLPARLRPPAGAQTAGPQPTPGQELLPGLSGLDGSTTRRRLLVDDVAGDAERVLRYGDGSPALLTARRGAGRVALLTTTVDDDWTDLPYRPGFLPLVVRLLRWLAPTRGTPNEPFPPGATVRFRPPPTATRVVITAPDGARTALSGADLEDDVAFDQTGALGGYRVALATTERGLSAAPRLAFVVAPPASESDLSVTAPPVARAGPRDRDDARAVVADPLDRWLFLLLGLLAALEAALRVRRLPGRRR